MNAGIDNEPNVTEVTFAFQRNSSETAPLLVGVVVVIVYLQRLVPTTIIIDICTAISKSLSFLATRREGSRFLARWAAVNRVVVFDDRWCDANPDLYHIETAHSVRCVDRVCLHVYRTVPDLNTVVVPGLSWSGGKWSTTITHVQSWQFRWREWTKCSSLT